MATTDIYANGEFLAATGGTWHVEDSPFKARQVLAMMQRHEMTPKSACEIGCGAGGILVELSRKMADCWFVGYDISPQAYEMSTRRWTDQNNLSFVLGDAFEDREHFDLVLVMDVVEHVEDCFDFLRKAKNKGDLKIYHIPLEIACTAALRDYRLAEAWTKFGHLHSFALATALQAMRHTGHEVIDYRYTNGALECPKSMKTRMVNCLRRMMPPSLAAPLLGGYSLLILAR